MVLHRRDPARSQRPHHPAQWPDPALLLNWRNDPAGGHATEMPHSYASTTPWASMMSRIGAGRLRAVEADLLGECAAGARKPSRWFARTLRRSDAAPRRHSG